LPSNSTLEIRTNNGCTPLHHAAIWGQIKVAHICLSLGANPNARNNIGNTPLHTAAAYGHLNLGRLLINSEAVVNNQNDQSVAPLHTAAYRGDYEFLVLLLESGASVEALSLQKATPLHLATLNGHVECCELLLKYGAEITALDAHGQTPLLLATQSGSTETIRCLLAHSAGRNVMKPKGGSLLHYSGLYGPLSASNLLVDRSNYVEGNLSHGKMAPYTLEELVNLQDINGKTPLHFAVQIGGKDLVLALLEAGSDLCVQDRNGWQSLHCAAHFNNYEIARLLLSRGAKVNDICDRGRSALHLASAYDNQGLILLLLKHGAQCFPDSSGWTPIDIAQQHGFDLVAALLQKASSMKYWTVPCEMKWPTRWSDGDRASDLILKYSSTVVELSGQLYNLVERLGLN